MFLIKLQHVSDNSSIKFGHKESSEATYIVKIKELEWLWNEVYSIKRCKITKGIMHNIQVKKKSDHLNKHFICCHTFLEISILNRNLLSVKYMIEISKWYLPASRKASSIYKMDQLTLSVSFYQITVNIFFRVHIK